MYNIIQLQSMDMEGYNRFVCALVQFGFHVLPRVSIGVFNVSCDIIRYQVGYHIFAVTRLFSSSVRTSFEGIKRSESGVIVVYIRVSFRCHRLILFTLSPEVNTPSCFRFFLDES